LKIINSYSKDLLNTCHILHGAIFNSARVYARMEQTKLPVIRELIFY
jgi:hypothetical protein